MDNQVTLNCNSVLCILLALFLASYANYAQSNNTKQGGISFRIDDNQDSQKYDELSAVFKKYDFSFCLALNPGYFENDQEYINSIRRLQIEGNEIMDHTPDHRTNYFYVHGGADQYENMPGVDHINGNQICLEYNSINLNSYLDEGRIIVKNDTVISIEKGEFNNIDGLEIYCIYIESMDRLFNISKIFNKDASNVDTLIIKSFWNENISLGNQNNISYDKIGQYDVSLTDNALNRLAERSYTLFTSMDITPPQTWIQPGGPFPQLTKTQIKNSYGKYFNFTAGAVYPSPSLKCFNEYNPKKENNFAMQWGDFNDGLETLQNLKSKIIDQVAKHFVIIGNNHFSSFLGGWSGYLHRMDSLLYWCRENSIIVSTYRNWVDKLYYVPLNCYENIIPPLSRDIDKNGIPDGWNGQIAGYRGKLNNTDSADKEDYACYEISSTGGICSITRLAGIEKGEVDFAIYTKGSTGDSIMVEFIYSDNFLINKKYIFPAVTDYWKKYSLSSLQKVLIIPDECNMLEIRISCVNYKKGIVKISSMSLRKKTLSPIPPPWNLVAEIKNNKSVLLNWVDNSSDETGFMIYRKLKIESIFKAIDSVGSNFTSYVDTTVTENVLYEYRVNTYSKTEHSEFSNSIEIKTPKLFSTFYYFQKGWNLFSVPTKLSSTNYTSIFPNSSSIFTYSNVNGYIKQYNIEPGKAYWVNINSPFVQNTFGAQSDIKTVKLVKGWNMIGVYDSTVSVKNLITSPPGIIQSNVFSYSNGYIVTDSLKPTRGYWLNCSSDGILDLDAPFSNQPTTMSTSINGLNGTISITDANNSKGVLFLTEENNANDKYDLPPVPPENAFDIRWSTNRFAEFVGRETKTINILNARFPLSVVVENIFMNIKGGNGRKFTKNIITKKETFQIEDSLLTKLFVDNASLVNVKEKSVPTFYQLMQNFPNPFNPNTEIKYSLPLTSSVKIQIFNLIGQFVDGLVNTIQDPGFYRLVWTPNKLSSGVYFCVLEAHSEVSQQQYRDVKKVLYLK